MLTSADYWDEIERLAVAITKEAREYDRNIHDVLRETIDGHRWVIYCRFSAWVLAHSSNESAMWDEGLEDGIMSHDEYMTRAAYCAMVADVYDHEAFDAEEESEDDDANE